MGAGLRHQARLDMRLAVALSRVASSGITHTVYAEIRNEAALIRNATLYPNTAAAHPPSADPTAISRNLVENNNAVPASSPSLPVRFGAVAFLAPSKKAPNVCKRMVAMYAIQRSSGRVTSRNDSATTARAISVTIITSRREKRSTNVPANGDAKANGINRATKNNPAAVGEASETSRTSPRPAIKLNQLPSSEINCPASR